MASLQEEREAGIQARRLLEDPVLAAAYEQTRTDIMQRWPTTQKTEDRESLWRELQALDSVWRKLADALATGEMAEQQMSRGNR